MVTVTCVFEATSERLTAMLSGCFGAGGKMTSRTHQQCRGPKEGDECRRVAMPVASYTYQYSPECESCTGSAQAG
jgi:hypothetical protein